MLSIVIASSIGLVIGYIFGFYVRDLWDKIHSLQKKVKTVVKHETSEPKSTILEPPLTPAERVAREQEELIERLNPS